MSNLSWIDQPEDVDATAAGPFGTETAPNPFKLGSRLSNSSFQSFTPCDSFLAIWGVLRHAVAGPLFTAWHPQKREYFLRQARAIIHPMMIHEFAKMNTGAADRTEREWANGGSRFSSGLLFEIPGA